MELVHIEKTQDTPEVKLNPESGHLEFYGRSYPDDAKAIFNPILEWLEEYIKSPNEETIAEFKFTYFNTASSKMILEILDRLARINENGKKITINWHYKEIDEDMLDAGEEYSDIVELPFNYLPYSS